MKKIPTLFIRNPDDMKLVTDKVAPGLEWVLDGHCIAREKLDGTACAIFKGLLYKRYTARGPYQGSGFLPSSPRDEEIGKRVGWAPVGDGPDDRWHREAMKALIAIQYPHERMDGTYELVGPKVQGNPHLSIYHNLMRHDATDILPVKDLSFSGLEAFLAGPIDSPENARPIEGIVFWGPEGPVAKIKRKDYNLPWPIQESQG